MKLCKCVYSHINENVFFTFDFNTDNKFENGGRVIYTESDTSDEVALNIMLNDNLVKFRTIIYAKEKNNYIKKEFEMIQYLYKIEDVVNLLKKTGFKNIKVCDEHFNNTIGIN